MSTYERTSLKPRHFAWIPQTDLAYLQVADRGHGTYCQLWNPSRELALSALWEAIQAYAAKYRGEPHAPPLEITAVPQVVGR